MKMSQKVWCSVSDGFRRIIKSTEPLSMFFFPPSKKSVLSPQGGVMLIS